MFNLILSKLADRGVSPSRAKQVSTENGCEFSSDAPFYYDDDEGNTLEVSSHNGGYKVIDSSGCCVAIGYLEEHVDEILPEIVYCPSYRV